jgi:PAS domain-containing protein
MDTKEKLTIATEIAGLFASIFVGAKFLYKKALLPTYNYFKGLKDLLIKIKPSSGADIFKQVENTTAEIKTIKTDVVKNQEMIAFGYHVRTSALNALGLAFWHSENGNCIYASPGLQILMGRSEDEILGNNWSAWIPETMKDRIFIAYKVSIDRLATFNEYYSFVRSDGYTQPVHGYAEHFKVGDKVMSFGWLKPTGPAVKPE